MPIVNTFMFENLKPLYSMGEGTCLCIYEPTRQLYVVKQASINQKPYYDRIASVSNPHLAKILFVCCQDDGIAVVREYISGESLSDKLKREKTLSHDTATTIIAQICEGLGALHKNGLVHRDVTPNNIIITSDGNVKIIDYGIARSFEAEKSADTVILGTPGYAAPEQFGFSQSNARTDIYAVGVLLNIMLTGKLPGACVADGALGRIVAKCIKIDSKQRFESMEELKAALHGKKDAGGPAERLIKALPGVRSPHMPMVILSILLYLIAAVLSIAHFALVKKDAANILLAIGSYIASTLIPFCCFHNFLGIWDKLPFTGGASRRTQRILYYTVGGISLMIGLILFSAVVTRTT